MIHVFKQPKKTQNIRRPKSNLEKKTFNIYFTLYEWECLMDLQTFTAKNDCIWHTVLKKKHRVVIKCIESCKLQYIL